MEIDRVEEISCDIVGKGNIEVIEQTEDFIVEKMPGGFEEKGLQVNRITIEKNKSFNVNDIKSFHSLVSIKGKAQIIIKNKNYDIPLVVPNGKMLLIPAICKNFEIRAIEKVQIIDIFTPVVSF